MGIVIDINTISCVFNKNDSMHNEFFPVFEWINLGKGKMIIGGTKYTKELLKCVQKHLALFIEFKKTNKILHVNDSDVDAYEAKIFSKTTLTDCDDQHIIAVVAISRCKLICSKDKRAYPFFKKRELYPAGQKTPSIYSGKRNIRILSHKYKIKQ